MILVLRRVRANGDRQPGSWKIEQTCTETNYILKGSEENFRFTVVKIASVLGTLPPPPTSAADVHQVVDAVPRMTPHP